MAEHLSDEEQLESLKRWWRESGTQLLLTVVLVAGGWFGWQQWQTHRDQKIMAASVVYLDMMELVNVESLEQLSDDDKRRLTTLAETLRSEHATSLYGQYAGMMLARLALFNGEVDAAAQYLRNVVAEDDDSPELVAIARLRLARVEMERQNYAAALQVLEAGYPEPMTTLFAELRGDIHYLTGDAAAARAAYQTALDNLSTVESSARVLLELKQNRVLATAPTESVEKDEA